MLPFAHNAIHSAKSTALQIQETEREIAAYSAAIAQLESEAVEPLSDAELAEELERAKAGEEDARRATEALEAEVMAVEQETSSLREVQQELEGLEEQYWQSYNDYMLQLNSHIQDRDALLNQIDRANQRLQVCLGFTVSSHQQV